MTTGFKPVRSISFLYQSQSRDHLFEIQTAVDLKKQIMLMHETDARHGAFDFGPDEVREAPAEVAQLLLDHESLPWRRRRFEQDSILQELIKNAAITPCAGPTLSTATPSTVAASRNGGILKRAYGNA